MTSVRSVLALGLVCSAIAFASGCGDEGEPDAAETGDGGAPGLVAGEWQTLAEGDWDIEAETETYRCVRKTVTEDLYLSALRPTAPLGTHHTVVTIEDEPTEPDGVSVCDVGTNARRSIMGSGVGTNAFVFPEGVAARIRAGQQLLINLHLFNGDDEPLEGTSGLDVQTIDESEVEHVAEGILAGPLNLEIPPGRVTQSGPCTMTNDTTLLAVIPHAHQQAVHMKGVARSSIDGDVTIHDEPYSFDSQLIHAIEPVRMAAGDVVDIECTYQNETGETLTWGDSSLAEMCFLGLWRYPASDDSFLCTE